MQRPEKASYLAKIMAAIQEDHRKIRRAFIESDKPLEIKVEQVAKACHNCALARACDKTPIEMFMHLSSDQFLSQMGIQSASPFGRSMS